MGATDCEALRDALLTQPVNALSSLVLVVAGVVIVHRHAKDRMVMLFGGTVVLVGIGSFLFHGPQLAGSRQLHDLANFTAAVALGTLAWAPRPGWGQQTPLRITVVSAVLASAVMFSWEEAGQWLVAGAALVAAVGLMRRGRNAIWGIALFGVGAVVLTLGRTGGPLCDPGSVWQPHAAWHLLAAVGFVVLADALTD
ncbi:MAG: hypothetical protein HKO87_04555 [Acidimicrobiia bacterium]|nr:hypothetical protein [Acidimicrobiia bacterium]